MYPPRIFIIKISHLFMIYDITMAHASVSSKTTVIGESAFDSALGEISSVNLPPSSGVDIPTCMTSLKINIHVTKVRILDFMLIIFQFVILSLLSSTNQCSWHPMCTSAPYNIRIRSLHNRRSSQKELLSYTIIVILL